MIFKPRHDDSYRQRLMNLRAKGGIMFFVIERQNRLYKGTIMLSPLVNSCQRRAVYVREYTYNEVRNEAELS